MLPPSAAIVEGAAGGIAAEPLSRAKREPYERDFVFGIVRKQSTLGVTRSVEASSPAGSAGADRQWEGDSGSRAPCQTATTQTMSRSTL